jgi:DNA-directed RNA polymerase subunit beta'
LISLKDRVLGRYSSECIKHPVNSNYIVRSGDLITEGIVRKLNFFGIHKIRIMSPLTSINTNSISIKSYGIDLSTGKPVRLGTAVGVMAAQSIGEPGTQLTMRTFHIGGIANKEHQLNKIISLHSGIVLFRNFKALKQKPGFYYVLSNIGYISILNIHSKIQFKYNVGLGHKLFIKNKSYVRKGDVIAS